MKVIIHLLASLSLGLATFACQKNSHDDVSAPLAPVALNTEELGVKSLGQTTIEDHCVALKGFITAYAQTYLTSTTVEFTETGIDKCMVDPTLRDYMIDTTFKLHQGDKTIEYRYSMQSAIDQDYRFSDSIYSLGIVNPGDLTFDKSIFGEKIKNLDPSLKAWSNLDGNDLLILNQRAEAVYKKFLKNFAPGNSRDFVIDPVIKAEFVLTSSKGGEMKILAIDAKYFDGKSYLGCDDSECLAEGLTFEFGGNYIIVMSKPVPNEYGGTTTLLKFFKLSQEDID